MKKQKARVINKASVRYDANKNSWVVCDDNGVVVEAFHHGYLKNATFSRRLTRDVRGCAQHNQYVGIATGELHIDVYSKQLKSLVNVNFDGTDGCFRDGNYNVLTEVKLIQLMPDRKALIHA